MDPATVFSTIVNSATAIKEIEKIYSSSIKNELAMDDSRYYSSYLMIAGKAVEGLEGEYLEILKQALSCNLDDQKEISDLQNRISDYVNGEVLRPKLREAIDRLEKGRDALSEHAERLLIWPSVKEKRIEAIEKYDDLIGQLNGYLGALGDYAGPSAAALGDIKGIQKVLDRNPIDKNKLKDMINELLMSLDKSVLITTTGNCGRVIETLRLAFR